MWNQAITQGLDHQRRLNLIGQAEFVLPAEVKEIKTMLEKLTGFAMAGALMISSAPAFAQSGATTPPQTAQEEGTTSQGQTEGLSQEPDDMRQMMREMMREMMQDMMRQAGPGADDRGEDQARPRGEGRWREDGRRDRRGMMHERGMSRDHGGGMRPGAAHGAKMRIMFAIVDADSDGALSLEEVRDFQARIFNAVDEDGDGRVVREEIEAFFHGATEERRR
jgi:hypothetical protein